MPEEANNRMKTQLGFIAAVCFCVAGFTFAVPQAATAQDQSAVHQPPKMLVINREFLKPGDSGSAHEKTEGAFTHDMSQANSGDHYLGAVSLTGKAHALFFHGYDSYADWQKTAGADMNNAALEQKIDSDFQADGELLTDMDTGVFEFEPDLSVSPAVDVPHMRFLEITEIKVKLGHEQDWMQLSKLYDSVMGKTPNAHWAMYRLVYGNTEGIYIAFHFIKSMAEVDQDHQDSMKAFTSMSQDQMKQMTDLEVACCTSIGSNLFALDPDMSYVGDKWKSADPNFWKQ